MRVIWTIIWAFLLSLMTAYVVGNMGGGGFHFSQVIIMTAIITLAVIILGDGLLKEEEA